MSLKHDVVVLEQEHAMPRFRSPEWIVSPIVVPVSLLLLVCVSALFRG